MEPAAAIRVRDVRLPLIWRLDTDMVIYGIFDFLLRAQVTLGGLYGHVPEEDQLS